MHFKTKKLLYWNSHNKKRKFGFNFYEKIKAIFFPVSSNNELRDNKVKTAWYLILAVKQRRYISCDTLFSRKNARHNESQEHPAGVIII